MAAPHREGEWLKGIVILPPGICQPLWQAGNQLPAPAGLCHSGFLGTSFRAIFISEHLLVSPESHIGNNSCVAMPVSPPNSASKFCFLAPSSTALAPCCLPKACPRFATPDPTLYNCWCFNIHAMSPHPLLLPRWDEFPLATSRSWKHRQVGIKGFKLAQRGWKMLPKDRRKRLSSEI